MNDWTQAVWRNGKKTVRGSWKYNWNSDSFTISLDVRDRIKGANSRTLTVTGDFPEWGNWKREKP